MRLAADLEWGTVPAWFGGLSLVLALAIFMRDRSALERKDVDLIGVWWKTEYERKAPWSDGGRVETGTVKLTVNNAGNLPVEIVKLAVETNTKWLVRDTASWDRNPDGGYGAGPGTWTVRPGIQAQKHFLGRLRPPPQEKHETSYEVDVAHMAPDHADQLDLTDGIDCRVLWMLVIDNAGRRWEIRPGAGRRARRIRWYSRRREYQPHEFWTNASRIRGWEWRLRVWWGRRRNGS